MSSDPSSCGQTKLEMETEQAVELLFDSITPIVPVFLVSGRESDHEQMIEAAKSLLLLYRSGLTADSNASSPSSSSGGSYVTANLPVEFNSADAEEAGPIPTSPVIALFNEEVSAEAKSITPDYISKIFIVVETHCRSMADLIREHGEAKEDVSQDAESKKTELWLNGLLIGQDFKAITSALNCVRELSEMRVALHERYGKMEWTDDGNEYRNLILKFRKTFSEHKTKRTDKMIVGMKKYCVLFKEAMEAVMEAQMALWQEDVSLQVLPGLTRFCDNLADRAKDRCAREERAKGRGVKRRRGVGE